MKRFLLYLLALTPLSAFADLPPTGYYRVRNVDSGWYLSIVDTKTSSTSSDVANGQADLRALYMLSDFSSQVAFNPASICYIEDKSSGNYNISGQGLDLYNLAGRYFKIKEISSGVYEIYAEVKSTLANVSRNLTHSRDRNGFYTYPSITGSRKNWNILGIDNDNNNQYFGVKPDVSYSDGSYWATMYAGFPFEAASADTKVYVVSQIDETRGFAVITEVEKASAELPVLIRCSSATPSDNRLDLLAPGTTSVANPNTLVGNYYCNDVNDNGAVYPHRNVTPYQSTMRMLGTHDGKPAFVRGTAENLVISSVDGKSYLPANKCYLQVTDKAPDVLRIVTEAEYATGIHEIGVEVSDDIKVIYDLQGRRVTTPSKGLYIVGGKKVLVK